MTYPAVIQCYSAVDSCILHANRGWSLPSHHFRLFRIQMFHQRGKHLQHMGNNLPLFHVSLDGRQLHLKDIRHLAR